MINMITERKSRSQLIFTEDSREQQPIIDVSFSSEVSKFHLSENPVVNPYRLLLCNVLMFRFLVLLSGTSLYPSFHPDIFNNLHSFQ